MSSRKKTPLQEKLSTVEIGPHVPARTSTPEYSGAYRSIGFDNSFSIDEFRENFRVQIISKSKDELVFDLIGIDTPFANAFRRILLAEVPTMAIEHVYIENNTSVVHDEMIAHRLGLVPIKADPRKYDFRASETAATEVDTLTFRLDVTCTHDPKDKTKLLHERVYSKDLICQQQQKTSHNGMITDDDDDDDHSKNNQTIRPVHDNILIAMLRPGQNIKLTAHCIKGIGRDHVKWSPVGTATYRLLPKIEITKELNEKQSQELVNICPMKVFDIEDIGGTKKAVVARPRNCSMCRACITHPTWPHTDAVKLERIRDHFIFSIETTGALEPEELFREAIQILIQKCNQTAEALANTQAVIEP